MMELGVTALSFLLIELFWYVGLLCSLSASCLDRPHAASADSTVPLLTEP